MGEGCLKAGTPLSNNLYFFIGITTNILLEVVRLDFLSKRSVPKSSALPAFETLSMMLHQRNHWIK